MRQTEKPLTPGQLSILRAAQAGGSKGVRAMQIAELSRVSVRGVYAVLGRLVARRLLARSRRRPPTYLLTADGERHLVATERYREALAG